MRIVVIGSGNVGWHLTERLWTCGLVPVQVFSRSAARAHALAGKVSTAYTTDLTQIEPAADLYILAVPDDAISGVSRSLAATIKTGAAVVHTSGSVASEALTEHADHGVFYPLQTFTAGKPVDWSRIPVLLTASTDTLLAKLRDVTAAMQCPAHLISDDQRAVLHLAATIACNFTNHMYSVAQTLLDEHQLDFDLLQPLITETAQKVRELPPRKAQTGPAIRGDQKTLQKHMALLQGKPQLAILYALISRSISSDS